MTVVSHKDWEFDSDYLLIPFGVALLDAWGTRAIYFYKIVSHKLIHSLGNPRSDSPSFPVFSYTKAERCQHLGTINFTH